MLTSLKRIIKNGWRSFSRNLGINIATIFVIITAIFLISFLFVFNAASKILISNIQKKVDMTVYFKENVAAEKILDVKSDVAKLPEVKDVEYVSKEDALTAFIEKHKNDPLIMESLREVGDNPFPASLNIRAQQAANYEQIAGFLAGYYQKDLIEKVDYSERKPVIDQIFSTTSSINRGGVILGIALAVIALLVTINTIRIAISNSSEEIETMRLVGASNRFIQGPFLVQGAIAGIIAALVSFLAFLAISYGLDAKIKVIAPSISTFGLFLQNFWLLLLFQLLIGVGLAMISSAIAVRKYLKV